MLLVEKSAINDLPPIGFCIESLIGSKYEHAELFTGRVYALGGFGFFFTPLFIMYKPMDMKMAPPTM